MLLALTLAALVGAVCWPVARYPFAGFDDDAVVLNMPAVREGLSVAGVRWAFTTMLMGMWIPLAWPSRTADIQIFGLSAGGHHLVNVALHTASWSGRVIRFEFPTNSRLSLSSGIR